MSVNLNHNFNQIWNNLKEEVQNPAIEGLEQKYFDSVNIGALIVQSQLQLEALKDQVIQDKGKEVEVLHDRLETFTDIVSFLEDSMSKSAGDIEVSSKSELFEKAYAMFPDERLKKGRLKRTEAEALVKFLTRRNEAEARQINHKMVEVNRTMEERHELLQIAREILKMQREFIQSINNRTGRGG